MGYLLCELVSRISSTNRRPIFPGTYHQNDGMPVENSPFFCRRKRIFKWWILPLAMLVYRIVGFSPPFSWCDHFSSWWLVQPPILKICTSQTGSFPYWIGVQDEKNRTKKKAFTPLSWIIWLENNFDDSLSKTFRALKGGLCFTIIAQKVRNINFDSGGSTFRTAVVWRAAVMKILTKNGKNRTCFSRAHPLPTSLYPLHSSFSGLTRNVSSFWTWPVCWCHPP